MECLAFVYMIKKKIDFFSKYKNEMPKKYISGENFCYLGKNYRLKVIEANEECVKLQRGYLQLFVKDKNNTKQKRVDRLLV